MSWYRNIKSHLLRRIAKRLEEENFISKQVVIGKATYLSGTRMNGTIEVGDNCKIYKAHLDGNVLIGRYTSVWGPNIYITSKLFNIKIGSFCSIARNVSIQEYNHKYDRFSTYHINSNLLKGNIEEDVSSKGPITIGNDVWIGAGAVILSGVTIGNGAVIGANSVVTHDIPPFAIAAGNPAGVIKFRFNKQTIDEIEKTKWWDWPIDRIVENKNLFTAS